MQRREFISAIAAAAAMSLATPARAETKSLTAKRIAIVSPSRTVEELKTNPYYRSFIDELGRLGFIEGKNLVVERYSGKGETGTYGGLIRAVVNTRPNAIMTAGGTLSLAAKAATQSIPIVASVGDPVAMGLVSNLARPGINVTGVTADAGLELYGKRLELLAQLLPNMSRVGYLTSPTVWRRSHSASVTAAAQKANIALVLLWLGETLNESAYSAAFSNIDGINIDALLISDEAEHVTNSRILIDLASNARIPTIYPYRDLVVAGGLMAYCVDLHETYRYAASQMAEILRGKNPAELPFYQPTKFQFIINAKAARRIGFEMPPSLLARADEVIE